MSSPSEEERFSTVTKGLINLIHGSVVAAWEKGFKKINPQLVGLAGGYVSGIDKKELIETFISGTEVKHPGCWEQIRERQEKFFIEHTDAIFGNLPVGKEYIDSFREFFTDPKIIEKEDKGAIFDHVSSMVKICIKYVHRVRQCYLEEDPETKKMRPRYRYNIFPAIKVREHAKKWEIKLPMPTV